MFVTQDLHRPLGTLQANGTQKEIRPEVLEELKAKGMGYVPKEFAAPKNPQDAKVSEPDKSNQTDNAKEQKGQTIPPSANDYQVNINGENRNLNDIRAQTRKNLLGDAQVTASPWITSRRVRNGDVPEKMDVLPRLEI